LKIPLPQKNKLKLKIKKFRLSITGINYILKYMKKSCNNISQYLVFLLYFDQINVALEHMIDFLKTFFLNMKPHFLSLLVNE